MNCPLFFGPGERPLFGWLHLAPAPGRLGLVVCNPFGYESICAHRSLRHIADAAAASGVTTLRFDYDGTGDSAGDDRDPDRLNAWVGSVHAAVEALRAHAAVERVCLLGVRLGSLIATLAATDRNDVEALVAIAPVVSGRAHVRELKVLQTALGLRPAPDTDSSDDVQEAVGFALTAETRAALAGIDLAKSLRVPAPHILVLDRDDLPGAEAWAAVLAGRGAHVEALRLPGYVEMMLDPHETVVPASIVRTVAGWLAARQTPAAAGHSASPVIEARGAGGVRVAAGVIERPVVCDGGAFGILAAPALPEARTGRAILLLNSGAVHHIGPNRLWTALARRWAAMGHLALRLDITGIGDSRTRPGDTENTVYSPRALEDVAEALALLRAQPDVHDCHAMGICSGAYHAFKAAVAGQPLAGIVVINPLTFFWHEGESLKTPGHRVAADVERYSTGFLRVDKWKKLLRGQVDVRHAARSLGRYAADAVSTGARDISRRAGVTWREDLGAELETIVKRKIDLRFVFAADDPGLRLLRSQGGSALPTLQAGGKLSISTIDGPDHNFTPLWSHAALTRILAASLDGTQ